MTLASILVATDLSSESDDVVRAAGALAALTDAELHILHAFDLELSPYPRAATARPGFHGHIHAATQQLAAQVERAVGPGVAVATREIEIFVAHKAILARARAVEADLIVLGPHRSPGSADGFLGTTADRVLRTATVPCLVVRRPLSLPLRRVLVPLDLSSPGRGAFQTALAWCRALRPADQDPVLTALHVLPRVFALPDMPLDRSVIESELHRQVDAELAEAPQTTPVTVQEEVRQGDTPTEEIVRVLVEDGTDLVVLATHGYGALERALIGSVASGVARAAPCPVLLVPPAVDDAG